MAGSRPGRRPPTPAKGFESVNGMMVISCRFDPETFRDLLGYAERHNMSVAGAIRDMVEIGLEETDG